jgi:hypothetical protein
MSPSGPPKLVPRPSSLWSASYTTTARSPAVLLGGLVPQLLCSHSAFRHAGTTDVDVQVDLEIASGATRTGRLEQALANAEFRPDSERGWRWELQTETGRKAQVKFELLADLEDQQQGAIITFATASSWAPSTCVELGMPLATSRSRRYAPRTAGSCARSRSTCPDLGAS